MAESSKKEHPSAFLCSNTSNAVDYAGEFQQSTPGSRYQDADVPVDYSSIYAQNAALKEHWMHFKNALDVCSVQSDRIDKICNETQNHATNTQKELEEKFRSHYTEIQKAIEFFTRVNAQNLNSLQLLQESVAAYERAHEEHVSKFNEFMQTYQAERDEVRQRKKECSDRIKQLGKTFTEAEAHEARLTDELRGYTNDIVRLKDTIRGLVCTKLGHLDRIEDYSKYINGIVYLQSNQHSDAVYTATGTAVTGGAVLSGKGDKTHELVKIIVGQDANKYMQSINDSCGMDNVSLHDLDQEPRNYSKGHNIDTIAYRKATDKRSQSADGALAGSLAQHCEVIKEVGRSPSAITRHNASINKPAAAKRGDARSRSESHIKRAPVSSIPTHKQADAPLSRKRATSAMLSLLRPNSKHQNISQNYLHMSNVPMTRDQSIEEEIANQRRRHRKEKQDEELFKQEVAASASANLHVHHVNGWEVVRETPKPKIKVTLDTKPLTADDLGTPKGTSSKQTPTSRSKRKKGNARKRPASSRKEDRTGLAVNAPKLKDIYKEEAEAARAAERQTLTTQVTLLLNQRRHAQQQLNSLLDAKFGKYGESSDRERGEQILKMRDEIKAMDERYGRLSQQLDALG